MGLVPIRRRDRESGSVPNVLPFSRLITVDTPVGRFITDGFWVVPAWHPIMAPVAKKMKAENEGKHYYRAGHRGKPELVHQPLADSSRASVANLIQNAELWPELTLTKYTSPFMRVMPDGTEIDDHRRTLVRTGEGVQVGESLLLFVTAHSLSLHRFTGEGARKPVAAWRHDGTLMGIVMSIDSAGDWFCNACGWVGESGDAEFVTGGADALCPLCEQLLSAVPS